MAGGGLVFGFLNPSIIDALEESRPWKERAVAIEQVEQLLSHELSSSERKARFAPHATSFLGFIIPFIKDVNVKMSLTAITMTNKMLVLDLGSISKNYSSVARALIEKLSDSKVVIRQAVLKCCGALIRSGSPKQFSNFAISYLGHTIWHVREGILHLLANCLIVQGQQDELNGNGNQNDKFGSQSEAIEFATGSGDTKILALNPILIGQLCQMIQNEIKPKILQMAIDDLSLCIEFSNNQQTTESIIRKELGVQPQMVWNTPDESQASRIGRELFNQIKQRQNPEYLPSMQIDGSIEFKKADSQSESYSNPHQFKSRGDFKPTQIEQQVSPSRHQGFDGGRIAPKNQHPSIPNRHRVTPPVEIEDQATNQKIQTWLPSFKNAQENNRMEDGDGRQYDQVGAFQGARRRLVAAAATSGAQLSEQTTPVGSQQNNSFNNMNRQRSQQPKGAAQHTALSNGAGREEAVYAGAQVLSSEPHSAGMQLGNHHPLRQLGQSTDEANNMIRHGQNIMAGNVSDKARQGYTPMQHQQKPRFIQSNEVRQRTLDNVSITQTSPSPKLLPRAGMVTKNDFVSINQSPLLGNDTRSYVGEPISLRSGAITGYNPQSVGVGPQERVQQVRNMSQSSGAPGGFGVNKAQINERLQLLKSTFKYKNQSEHEYHSNLGDARTFDNTDRRVKYDVTVGTTKKANSEYNARDNTKLPAVTQLNNNNYMLQTGGGVSGVSGVGSGGKAIERPQQTLNSFAMSNVSTNVNNNFAGGKSYSANKQLQSTNTTGYNFAASESKIGGARRDQNQYNAYESGLLETRNIKRSGMDKPIGGKSMMSGVKGSQLKGPIKATPINTTQQSNQQDQMVFSTIQFEQNKGGGYSHTQPTPHQQNQKQGHHQGGELAHTQSVKQEHNGPQLVANRKPPVSKGSINSLGQQQHYQYQNSHHQHHLGETDSSMLRDKDTFQTPKKSWNMTDDQNQMNQQQTYSIMGTSALGIPSTAQQTTTHYNVPEEPLRDPEGQFKQSLQDLKSSDWQKIFDALNVVKRIAQFHKEHFVMTSGPIPKEAIKLTVKHVENLRSQISKNACMTLQTIYSELPTKDLDSNIDLVLPTLLKKSTDTNHFVSEQAEKALMMVCHACTESKVFNSIQLVDGKGGNIRQKIALSYCFLIEKMGPRIRTHKESLRIVKAVVNMLGEGSSEARNQAKIGVAQIKNNIQNGREFDGLLMRCGLTEQQIDQAKKVADQDVTSVSQVNNTRYGGSMRGSSMDSRAHGSEALRRTPHVFPKQPRNRV